MRIPITIGEIESDIKFAHAYMCFEIWHIENETDHIYLETEYGIRYLSNGIHRIAISDR